MLRIDSTHTHCTGKMWIEVELRGGERGHGGKLRDDGQAAGAGLGASQVAEFLNAIQLIHQSIREKRWPRLPKLPTARKSWTRPRAPTALNADSRHASLSG